MATDNNPNLMGCVRDLLDRVFEKADEALPQGWDAVLMAAERVEAALEYDRPIVVITVGGDNGDGVVDIKSHPDWIEVDIIDYDNLVNGQCPACGSEGFDEVRCKVCDFEMEVESEESET